MTPRPGTLNVKSVNISADSAAGFNLAELECEWTTAASGQAQGTYDTSTSGYLYSRAQIALQLKNAGYQVAVSAGIFDPPSWVSSLANWQYVDQEMNGSGTPNFTWNPAVRSAAATYISALTSVMSAAGVSVDYYRIGIDPSGETLLPALAMTNGWWAFDALAQGSASGLPSGVSACPYPGWIPGTTTGGTLTTAEATTWWTWYMGAVNNAHQWEITAHRAGGWAGVAMLVTPGRGAAPSIITSRLASSPPLASGSGVDYTMNQAEAWHLMIPALASPSNMVIDISSVYNGDGGVTTTGTSGADNYPASRAADDAMTLAQADPNVSGWSSARWISYLARASGLACCGESVGDNPPPQMWGLASQVAGCMTQAQACGLYGLMWANDDTMNGLPGSPAYATGAQVVSGFRAAW